MPAIRFYGVRKKLFLSFGLLVFLLLSTVYLARHLLTNIENTINDFVEKRHPLETVLVQIELDRHEIFTELISYQHTGGLNVRQSAVHDLKDLKRRFVEFHTLMTAEDGNSESRLRDRVLRFARLGQRALQAIDRYRALNGEIAPLLGELDEGIGRKIYQSADSGRYAPLVMKCYFSLSDLFESVRSAIEHYRLEPDSSKKQILLNADDQFSHFRNSCEEVLRNHEQSSWLNQQHARLQAAANGGWRLMESVDQADALMRETEREFILGNDVIHDELLPLFRSDVQRAEQRVRASAGAASFWLSIAGICGLIVSGAASIYLSNRIIKSITSLKAGAEALGAGAEEFSFNLKDGDEFRGLAESLNDMARKRKQFEHLLSEKEQRLSAILEAAVDGIVTSDSDGRILQFNRAAEGIFGYRQNDILGCSVSALMPEPDSSRHDSYMQRYLQSGKRKIIGIGREVTGKRSDGSLFPMELAVNDFKVGSRVFFTGVIRDITQRRRAEEERESLEKQLRQSQKMEAIGVLAGGIAHDFNNILTAILGFADLGLVRLRGNEGLRFNLEQITKAAQRAKALVRQILTFSRQNEGGYRPVQLQEVACEVADLLRATMPATIAMNWEIEPGVGAVWGDSSQLHQVIMNLCTNAYQAMPDSRGVLSLKLENYYVSSEESERKVKLQAGPYVRLTVTDTGVGIAPEIIERIFEPFFTTRGVGEGSGMGLAVVHGIIESHNGAITVASKPGAGTIFEVYLPLLKQEIKSKTLLDQPHLQGVERVLFVEDEEPLAEMGREMLEYLGYKVRVEIDSVEALKIFRSTPDAFDVIVTDQTMTRLTGVELAREVRRLRPHIPIILTTGFSREIDEKRARGMGIDEFLLKPYVMSEIGSALRKALGSRRKDAKRETVT